MTDYSEHGAEPVDDAASDDPPTVDEVLERQRVEYPEQAATSTMQRGRSDEERGALDAGGDAVPGNGDAEPNGEGLNVEGPNSA